MLALLISLIIALIIALCLGLGIKWTKQVKWTKQEIADCYGVCRKTLGKWVKYCCPRISPEKWKKARKLGVIDVLIIFYEFGFPEGDKPLTKGDIIIRCETYYHTIRENIELNIEKLGIHKEAYSSLDVFPPRLSLQIVAIMGG